MFKKIAESIPLLTIILLSLSIIKQILYYWNYSIPIKYFLGISELGLIISDELIFSVPTIILLFYLNYFYVGLKADNKPKPSEKTKKAFLWISVAFFTCVISFFVIKFFSAKIYSVKLYYFSFLFVLSFFSFLLIQASDINSDFSIRINFYSATLFIVVIGLIIMKTGELLQRVDNGLYFGTKVFTSDSIYTSSKSSYFVGKTNSYVFIYNQADSTTTIIPTESINKIILKSN